MPLASTGSDTYCSITATLEENELCWRKIAFQYALLVYQWTVRISGFILRLKQDFPNVASTHCFLYWEVLVRWLQNVLPVLRNTMNLILAMVNYNKTRKAKTKLLKAMCQEAGVLHETLVLHTNIHWLANGKVFWTADFMNWSMSYYKCVLQRDFATLIKDEIWCWKRAYLIDIFWHLKSLNAVWDIFTSSNKLNGFIRKIKIWSHKLKTKCLLLQVILIWRLLPVWF